jgi:predicted nucleic acid-binding Zn ribbon protein
MLGVSSSEREERCYHGKVRALQMKRNRPRALFVLMVAVLALILALLVLRWMTFGPGNLTDNDFKPPSIAPISPTGSTSR